MAIFKHGKSKTIISLYIYQFFLVLFLKKPTKGKKINEKEKRVEVYLINNIWKFSTTISCEFGKMSTILVEDLLNEYVKPRKGSMNLLLLEYLFVGKKL